MNMDKIKFIHFEREGGDIKVKDLKIYAGCLGAPYEMEDIELHLTINDNGDIDILINYIAFDLPLKMHERKIVSCFILSEPRVKHRPNGIK